MALETVSEPSLQRLFLAPQPSPTEGPRCQGEAPKKEGPALTRGAGARGLWAGAPPVRS